MSFLISSVIPDIRRELLAEEGRLEPEDIYLFLNNSNEEYGVGYYMPTRETVTDFIVYPGIFEYPLPSDISYILEPHRPLPLRDSPIFRHQRAREFMKWYQSRRTSIEFEREAIYLLVDTVDGREQTIHGCESLSDNGSVSISGDGSALTLDNVVYQKGEASIRFTVTASGGTTTITFSGVDSQDITELILYGKFFLSLQAPDTNTVDLTSVELRIGNDASNYYSMSATERHRGDDIGPGWGVLSFDPASKTTTGTVDETEIDYLQVIITHGTTGVNGTYRIDRIFGATGTYYLLPYYSLHNIKDTDGTYKAKIDADSDTVLCPAAFDNVIKYDGMVRMAAKRLKDAGLADYCRQELQPYKDALMSQFPRQQQLISSNWYLNRAYRNKR